MVIQTLFTLVIIIAFIIIYKKYKTEDEEYLVLKLIGYYLLGSFRFNLNKLALPAGFIIYLVFFNPQTNSKVKKAIAALGLFAFVCALAIPAVQKSYFERERIVKVSGNNIFAMDLNKDFQAIKKKLGITEITSIETFETSYETSGAVIDLRYMLLARDNKGIVVYDVSFSPEKNRYAIKPTRVEQWLQHGKLISEIEFFYALKRIDFKQAKPPGVYSYFTFQCTGDFSNWGVKDFENFFIVAENEPQKLKDEELPVKGYVFTIYGNRKIGENSYSGEGRRAYILPSGW